ncbi:MAG: phosphatase PAP2 family protein [Marmoricola sp.]
MAREEDQAPGLTRLWDVRGFEDTLLDLCHALRMGSLTVWCVLALVVAGGVGVTLQLAESTWTEGLLAPRRARGLALLGAALLLVLLAVLLRVGPIARADGSVVRMLSHSRGDTLVMIMSILTTLGDSIPSFTIAAVLAVIVYRQSAHPVVCWVLPVMVLVEVLAQVAIGKVFGDLTISDVTSNVVSGNYGYLPSGSVARLSSIFLIAARLWYSTNRSQSRTIVTFGGALVVLQSVSRLYLGRHLVLDIVGGLLLGFALFLLVSFVIRGNPQIDHERGYEH